MESSPSPPNCLKDHWKLLPLLISINWLSLVTSWVLVQKIYSKMYLVSCTNTPCDITDLVNHGKVRNTKTWISCKPNIIFLQNKIILNLCLRWNILRSYHFVVEVTFKVYDITNCLNKNLITHKYNNAKGMTLKLCLLIEYLLNKEHFDRKSWKRWAPEASHRPLFNLLNNPKQPLHAQNSLKNKIFWKRIIKNP